MSSERTIPNRNLKVGVESLYGKHNKDNYTREVDVMISPELTGRYGSEFINPLVIDLSTLIENVFEAGSYFAVENFLTILR